MTIRLEGPSLPPRDGAAPSVLICLLHGLGADGADLLPLGTAYQTVWPTAAVVAPDAPFPCDMAPFGRMWFSVRNLGRDTRRQGVRLASPIAAAFIDAELAKRRLPPSAVILVGFSQGAMVALHLGLTRRPPPAAIISHSGLFADDELRLPDDPGWRPPPILLTHGEADAVLPPSCLDETEGALRARGLQPEVHCLRALGHGIDPATLSLGLAFLNRVSKGGHG
ncbi:MAG: phospholipase [Rhodospirillales bacterium]|jgi:phospholipase/carboxylesterase|nr:phospholipase [Rhodospirillales bacterium]